MKVPGAISILIFGALTASLVVPQTEGRAANAPPVIEVWHGAQQTFGQQGNPQRYINILGKVSDPDGIASLVYSLNNAPDSTLSIGPDGRRLASAGDFNIDVRVAELLGGTNQVVITATDNVGSIARDTVTVEYLPGRAWPGAYTIDWSQVASIQEVAQVVDGQWRLENGELRTAVPGYDRLVAIGDTAWTDYEVTVPLTIHSVNYQSGAGVGVLLRWTGHTDDPIAGWQPKTGWNPFGTISWWRWPYSPTARLELYGTGTGMDFTPVLGVRYLLKARVETLADQSGLYRLKAWEAGQAEPAGWQVQATRSSLSRGSFLLVAHYADVSFGNVAVVPLSSPAPPDTTPPTAPSGLTATAVSTSQIDLRWTAASDPESGVASYKVYRNGEMVGTTPDTAFSDTGLSAGKHYTYEVSVVNGAGLEGPKSAPVKEKTPLLVPGLLKPTAEAGLSFALEQNHPNPFNPATAIYYTLPVASRVRLVVYDALGRRVRVLVDAEQERGAQRAVWDGRDETGQRAAAGLYLYRLEAGAYLSVRKMLLVQ